MNLLIKSQSAATENPEELTHFQGGAANAPEGLDPILRALVESWPMLTPDQKHRILGVLVEESK